MALMKNHSKTPKPPGAPERGGKRGDEHPERGEKAGIAGLRQSEIDNSSGSQEFEGRHHQLPGDDIQFRIFQPEPLYDQRPKTENGTDHVDCDAAEENRPTSRAVVGWLRKRKLSGSMPRNRLNCSGSNTEIRPPSSTVPRANVNEQTATRTATCAALSPFVWWRDSGLFHPKKPSRQYYVRGRRS